MGADGPVRALVVTGGHDYPTSFYTVFEQDGLAWDHAVSNEEGVRADLRGSMTRSSCDIAAGLSEAGRQHFQDFVDSGGGVVALHHAIVSYPGWTWYRELLGGQYLQQPAGDRPVSTYLHDQDLDVRSVTPHPIARRDPDPHPRRNLQGDGDSANQHRAARHSHPTSDSPLAWVSA